MIADCGGIDESSDEALLKRDVFFPGYRQLGGMQGALALAAPRPLLLYSHKPDWLKPLYSSLGESGRIQTREDGVSATELNEWLKSQEL